MADDVTKLLRQLKDGGQASEEQLFAKIYKDLRQLAGHYMRHERPGHTLQATALVHEVYVRILGSEPVEWQNRQHFMQVASRAMRRVLVDYARSRKALKRGNPEAESEFNEESKYLSDADAEEVLAVHGALDKLAADQPRQAQVVELRYFGGHSFEEVADTLGVSLRTVKRDWDRARIILRRQITAPSL